MRSITSDAYEAFMNNRKFKRTNTQVVVYDNGDVVMLLYGREIVKKINDDIFISTAGYNTNTTFDRLRAFAIVTYRKGVLMLDNKYVWDGKWASLKMIENGTY
jgi:hypothetical protein